MDNNKQNFYGTFNKDDVTIGRSVEERASSIEGKKRKTSS